MVAALTASRIRMVQKRLMTAYGLTLECRRGSGGGGGDGRRHVGAALLVDLAQLEGRDQSEDAAEDERDAEEDGERDEALVRPGEDEDAQVEVDDRAQQRQAAVLDAGDGAHETR